MIVGEKWWHFRSCVCTECRHDITLEGGDRPTRYSTQYLDSPRNGGVEMAILTACFDCPCGAEVMVQHEVPWYEVPLSKEPRENGE